MANVLMRDLKIVIDPEIGLWVSVMLSRCVENTEWLLWPRLSYRSPSPPEQSLICH